MAMVSMKQSAEEAAEAVSNSVSNDAPEYPYGLSLSLDEESLAKLGMTQPPAVGTKFQITANITVRSASSYQSQDGESEATSTWQITDMEVSTQSNADRAASMLYGDK